MIQLKLLLLCMPEVEWDELWIKMNQASVPAPALQARGFKTPPLKKVLFVVVVVVCLVSSSPFEPEKEHLPHFIWSGCSATAQFNRKKKQGLKTNLRPFLSENFIFPEHFVDNISKSLQALFEVNMKIYKMKEMWHQKMMRIFVKGCWGFGSDKIIFQILTGYICFLEGSMQLHDKFYLLNIYTF